MVPKSLISISLFLLGVFLIFISYLIDFYYIYLRYYGIVMATMGGLGIIRRKLR